ncbi:serine/threonine-protein phosphatase 4 regulatory subunit 2-like [Triticum dicoccoides]|uniref:serine/threonine-protein phosphatase 4 regulatory subunit 2-like n=1 Tax=Triticum dicoccoides TaxID=85692 RepID=UPI000E7CF4D3|nr:serine/threonine-protein phosphatase 4 regulatory subunit 2-like [Triticum dicoccoides]XP_037464747.1 serine/threonine-protein phosphatase 4 regulatory subunit 2-like [Triticum dicoccoides]
MEGAATENSTVPMVAPEAADHAGQHVEGSTVPMVVPEAAVDAEQHVERSTVPMVVPEAAVNADQHVEGSTAPMVVPEAAVNADQHIEGSTVLMVVPETAVNADQRVEGSTVPVVVPEEAVGTDQRADAVAAPMVMTEADVDAHQRADSMAAPMVTAEAAAGADHPIEDAATQDRKHGDDGGVVNVTPEEMRAMIEVIAETGKFWHDWSFLKRLLSLQLMQVLGEYSEAQMVIREDGQQQNSLFRETHSELFSQLNDALLRFEEGPPFTLQRLCEILLDPKGTYTKLSKLALALEKNLLVTSTITKCTEPYPTAHGPNSEGPVITENTGSVAVEPERPVEHPAAVPNGTQYAGGDGDEEMADAEAEELPGSHDVEMQEEKPDQIPDVNSDTNSVTAVACETVNASEKAPDSQS